MTSTYPCALKTTVDVYQIPVRMKVHVQMVTTTTPVLVRMAILERTVRQVCQMDDLDYALSISCIRSIVDYLFII